MTATLVPSDAAELQDRFRLLYGKAGRRYFPKFALAETVQRRERVLNCNAHLYFDYPEDSVQHVLRDTVLAMRRGGLAAVRLRQAARLAAGMGEIGRAAARRWLRGLSPRGSPTGIRLQCHLEQAPDRDSRVLLSPQGRDLLGLPAMMIDWRLGALEHRTLQVMTETVSHEFARLGLGRLQPAQWLHRSDWQAQVEDCCHHIGTTRMATSPATGVVDPQCQVFGVNGLFVAGGSTFPTSGYANPTLTMVALAIRLADHLKARQHGVQRRATAPAWLAGASADDVTVATAPPGRRPEAATPLGTMRGQP
jgi:choline dehydrogenase-like flavoprotein